MPECLRVAGVAHLGTGVPGTVNDCLTVGRSRSLHTVEFVRLEACRCPLWLSIAESARCHAKTCPSSDLEIARMG